MATFMSVSHDGLNVLPDVSLMEILPVRILPAPEPLRAAVLWVVYTLQCVGRVLMLFNMEKALAVFLNKSEDRCLNSC